MAKVITDGAFLCDQGGSLWKLNFPKDQLLITSLIDFGPK